MIMAISDFFRNGHQYFFQNSDANRKVFITYFSLNAKENGIITLFKKLGVGCLGKKNFCVFLFLCFLCFLIF